MPFFKNSSSASAAKKNKTASAATTPVHTPRTSVQLNTSDVAAILKFTSLDTYSPKGTLSHMQASSMSRI
ncbi:hypothetical protein BGZ99_009192 [Dissophora globulifera]|uniref:Uncharacterized protein n=1 Tax=Dissophora globulifera TaxID=979702 RepID=A0A9P6RA35_9FUNG|nr:hypothetical protein BGZ99_009192 [Dissophora globulifera]